MLHIDVLEAFVEAREHVSVIALLLGLFFAFLDEFGELGLGSLLLLHLWHGFADFAHSFTGY